MSGSDRKVSSGAGRPAPGDDARPGSPGTGENVCPECHGTGELDGKPCQNCDGTGKVVEGIGGG